MIILAATDYGQLTPIVITVGTIISATASILMGFRGRAKWEPSEEDISKGPQRVASLITAVGIVIVWVRLNDPKQMSLLTQMAIGLGIATVIFLLFYGWLISVYTYTKIFSPKTGVAKEIKIIGGFSLTQTAANALKTNATSIQKVFAGLAYDADLVWPRSSRAAAKLFFVISYLGLTFAGTMALTAAAMMLLLNKPS